METRRVSINATEEFVWQVIGWREYVRGLYFHQGPDYANRNGLGHTRGLPAPYWGGETHMNCVGHAIEQTRQDAYARHAQRLMVTGKFALLVGVDPGQVHEWYLSVYVDAFEWVEVPNTIGISQFAGGDQEKFAKNPRMAQMYRTWDRMNPDRQDAVLKGAASILDRLDRGGVV